MSNYEIQYLNLLESVLRNGVYSKNRTGVNTYKIWGAQMHIDLSEGFPLLTTKKMHWKSVVHELLWMINGDTNIQYLLKNGVTFWTEWPMKHYNDAATELKLENMPVLSQKEFEQKVIDDDEFAKKWGSIGEYGYGGLWSSFPATQNLIKIEKRNAVNSIDECLLQFAPLNNSNIGDLSGKEKPSKKSGLFEIGGISHIDSSGRKFYHVKFKNTGYCGIYRVDAIKNGNINDPYSPTLCGIGYNGEYVVKSKIDKNLRKIWSHMIERCYNPKCKEYKMYGAVGVKVCDRWHNFSNFRKDCERLPQWNLKEKNISKYNLDKDYFGSEFYSPETCVWLNSIENRTYSSTAPIKVTFPTGESEIILSFTGFRKIFKIPQNTIDYYVKNGWHGFLFEKLDGLYRYPLRINQLSNVINELKNNPDSRRIIITAWHPYHSNNREDALLPACHNYIQFGTEELTYNERFQLYVNKGGDLIAEPETTMVELFDAMDVPKYRLNCYFNMRSSDTFLGLPFNCAFYALFTHLIANQLNMIPSQLVYTAADVHLYENHLEQVKLQLTRDIRKLPRLNIKTTGKSIFDIKFEDIEIIDYNPHSAIKAEVAV